MPGLQAADAVQSGTVEMCHTASYYYFGKDPTFAFGTAVPFGLNSRMQNAWMYFGGGMELMNDFYKQLQHLRAFRPAIPARRWAAGSARRSRSSPTSTASRCASAAFAGRVIAKLGVVPQQLAGGDIYAALEKGTIDACEWVGPYDDEKLGFHKVAQYYYYPGWWEGGPMLHNFINHRASWNALPPAYKSIVRTASLDGQRRGCRRNTTPAIRRRSSACRRRRAAARLPAGGDGRLAARPRSSSTPRPRGPTPTSRRSRRDARLPQRPVSVVAGRGASYDSYLVRNRTRT